MEFDEQEKLIIKALVKDPRMSDNSIGKLTKVPIRTVSRKRKKLEQDNRISYYVSINKRDKSRHLYLIKFKMGITKKKLLDEIKKEPKEKKLAPFPLFNPACCRLNLFPLLDEKAPSIRYELAAKLLRMFYAKDLFGAKKGIEYDLLDALLQSAKLQIKESSSLPLETIALADPKLQPLYYLMLKGTKNSNLFSSTGYPPLTDYLKIDRDDSPICLFHAHPAMLALFFGLKNTPPLFNKLHTEVKGGFELDGLLQLIGDPLLSFTDPTIWELLDLKKPTHKRLSNQTLIASDPDSGITIRTDTHRS